METGNECCEINEYSKSEARNPKQIQKLKKAMPEISKILVTF
jgi:hypothetical protein